jgi:hydrogenase nickel incorporation protein HypA/HybF
MHELSIANSVLDAVRAEMQRRPGARLRKVGLRVGELAGVDPEALSFSFQVLVQGTELEPATLEIEARPRRQRCHACGLEFVVRDYNTACPGCGAARTQCIGGDELELAYLELESPESEVRGPKPGAKTG